MPLTSLNAASNITHSAIASQGSSRLPTTFNAHCTGHCTLEDFNVNFANLDSKSVRFRTAPCTWYHVQERNVPDDGTATGTRVHYKVVWACARVSWTVNPRSSLSSENNGVAQTGVTLFCTINPFGPSAGCVSRVFLFVCLFVMSSVVHHEGGGLKVWVFPKTLGLIAWLRESMSRRNPSSRSASSPKVEKKVVISVSSCSAPMRGLSRSSRHLKPISLAKDLHQALKPKEFGTWDATDIANRRVKHHPFCHCLSRFFTSDDDLQCALYRTLYNRRFQRKFCESRIKVGTIPYRTVRMISRAGAQRTGSLNCNWDRSARQSSVRVSWTVNTRSSLAWENNGVSQTGVTLFYTINPFGPSAGRVSRYNSQLRCTRSAPDRPTTSRWGPDSRFRVGNPFTLAKPTASGHNRGVGSANVKWA